MWSTQVEIDWALALGEHIPEDKRVAWGNVPRIDLWDWYLQTMPLRQNWGTIDAGRVRQAVIDAIKREEADALV